MNQNDSPRRLKIAFFAHNISWVYRIRKGLKNSKKQKYFSSSLPKLELSISQKLFNLKTLIEQTNLEMIHLNKELRRRKKEVIICMESDKAFLPEEPFRITKILSFTEASISTVKSLCELLHKYLDDFYKIVFMENKSEASKDLDEKKIDLDWIADAANIRNDFLHNYSAWLFFQETDTAFTFGLELPDGINNKNWSDDFITIDQLNKIFEDFEASYKKIILLLIEKINKNKSRKNHS